MKSVSDAIQQPWYQEDGGEFFTFQEYNQVRGIFQEYVSGNITFSQAQQQYEQAVSQGFHEYIIQNHVNLSKY
ncbi:hypothetical protein GCM10025859_21570 [Alicyclobacillus fastidiosus]|nr:hypothetical protein GCM10025859_21570 [Alicyclobacillus fastidiosus]